MEQLQIPEKWHVEALVYLHEGEAWDDLRRERRAVQRRLSAIREMRKQGTISQGEFRELERECLRRLEKLKRNSQASDARYEKLLRDFPCLWTAATDEERKGLLHGIFSAIWVGDGIVIAYEPRHPFAALLLDQASDLITGDIRGQVEQLTDGLAQLPSP